MYMYCSASPISQTSRLLFRPVAQLVDLDDIVSTHIAVARLGWQRPARLHDARRLSGFPKPAKTVSRTLLWLWPDIEQWALSQGWVPWPGSSESERVMIRPEDTTPAAIIGKRLGLEVEPEASLVPGLVPVGTGPDDVALYRWGDAELLWHERANRTGRPS